MATGTCSVWRIRATPGLSLRTTTPHPNGGRCRRSRVPKQRRARQRRAVTGPAAPLIWGARRRPEASRTLQLCDAVHRPNTRRLPCAHHPRRRRRRHATALGRETLRLQNLQRDSAMADVARARARKGTGRSSSLVFGTARSARQTCGLAVSLPHGRATRRSGQSPPARADPRPSWRRRALGPE